MERQSNYSCNCAIIHYFLLPPQDDDDGHLTGLQIIEDLLEKCQETYISHLARLGVISHVTELAGPMQEVETVQEEPAVKENEEETEKKVWCSYERRLDSEW